MDVCRLSFTRQRDDQERTKGAKLRSNCFTNCCFRRFPALLLALLLFKIFQPNGFGVVAVVVIFIVAVSPFIFYTRFVFKFWTTFHCLSFIFKMVSWFFSWKYFLNVKGNLKPYACMCWPCSNLQSQIERGLFSARVGEFKINYISFPSKHNSFVFILLDLLLDLPRFLADAFLHRDCVFLFHFKRRPATKCFMVHFRLVAGLASGIFLPSSLFASNVIVWVTLKHIWMFFKCVFQTFSPLLSSIFMSLIFLINRRKLTYKEKAFWLVFAMLLVFFNTVVTI